MNYYTLEEVKKHNDSNSCWVVLDNSVYDVSTFLVEHPGGEEVILDRAGRDGTDCFDSIGHTKEARQLRENFKIGEVVKHQWIEKVYSGPSTSPDVDEEWVPKKKTSCVDDKVIPAVVILVAFYIFFFVL